MQGEKGSNGDTGIPGSEGPKGEKVNLFFFMEPCINFTSTLYYYAVYVLRLMSSQFCCMQGSMGETGMDGLTVSTYH